MRIDKFLKVSRILKRRSVACSACGQNCVFVNGRAVKPGHKIKIGDNVTVELGNKKITFVVKSLNEKATKDESSALYEIIEE